MAAPAAARINCHSSLRDPRWVLANFRKFNYFLVAVHGEMPTNADAPLAQVPQNTIVMQTGTGGSTGCSVTVDFDKSIKPYFETFDALRWLFSHMTGSTNTDPILQTISYNVGLHTGIDNNPACNYTPPEVYLDKIISLNREDVDKSLNASGKVHLVGMPLWGVYQLTHTIGGESTIRTLHADLTSSIADREFTRQSHVVTRINELFGDGGRINLIFFLNCNPAFACTDVSKYSVASEFCLSNTHKKVVSNTEAAAIMKSIKKPRYIPSSAKATAEITRTFTFDSNVHSYQLIKRYNILNKKYRTLKNNVRIIRETVANAEEALKAYELESPIKNMILRFRRFANQFLDSLNQIKNDLLYIRNKLKYVGEIKSIPAPAAAPVGGVAMGGAGGGGIPAAAARAIADVAGAVAAASAAMATIVGAVGIDTSAAIALKAVVDAKAYSANQKAVEAQAAGNAGNAASAETAINIAKKDANEAVDAAAALDREVRSIHADIESIKTEKDLETKITQLEDLIKKLNEIMALPFYKQVMLRFFRGGGGSRRRRRNSNRRTRKHKN
jgi:hypothetical protein